MILNPDPDIVALLVIGTLGAICFVLATLGAIAELLERVSDAD